MNRLKDRLDSLHYDDRVTVFLALMNTAGAKGLRYTYLLLLRIDMMILLPFTDMEDPWAFKNENFQGMRLYTGGGYFLK